MTNHHDQSTPARRRPPVTDIRTLGPLMLMVFGFVLAFTPMASVGVTGSVGNAGFVQKGPEPPPSSTTTTTMAPTTTTAAPTTTTTTVAASTTDATTTSVAPETSTTSVVPTSDAPTTAAPTTDAAGAPVAPVASAPTNQLPATGSVGWDGAWLFGVAMLLVGAMLLVSSRRAARSS